MSYTDHHWKADTWKNAAVDWIGFFSRLTCLYDFKKLIFQRLNGYIKSIMRLTYIQGQNVANKQSFIDSQHANLSYFHSFL